MGRGYAAAKARRQAATAAASGQGAVAEPVTIAQPTLAATPPTEQQYRVSANARALQTENSIATRRDMVESSPTYRNFPLDFSKQDRKTYEKIHSEASRLRQQLEDAHYKSTSEKTRTNPEGPKRYDPKYSFDAADIQLRLGTVFRYLKTSRQGKGYLKEARRTLNAARQDMANFLKR